MYAQRGCWYRPLQRGNATQALQEVVRMTRGGTVSRSSWVSKENLREVQSNAAAATSPSLEGSGHVVKVEPSAVAVTLKPHW